MATAKQTARQRGNRGNVAPVPTPGAPDHSGYAEPTRTETTHPAQPDPDAAGNRAAQVAANTAAHRPRSPATPGEPEEPAPPDDEPTPPGEHKREPIDDPDPADTKLHVQQSSR